MSQAIGTIRKRGHTVTDYRIDESTSNRVRVRFYPDGVVYTDDYIDFDGNKIHKVGYKPLSRSDELLLYQIYQFDGVLLVCLRPDHVELVFNFEQSIEWKRTHKRVIELLDQYVR